MDSWVNLGEEGEQLNLMEAAEELEELEAQSFAKSETDQASQDIPEVTIEDDVEEEEEEKVAVEDVSEYGANLSGLTSKKLVLLLALI